MMKRCVCVGSHARAGFTLSKEEERVETDSQNLHLLASVPLVFILTPNYRALNINDTLASRTKTCCLFERPTVMFSLRNMS